MTNQENFNNGKNENNKPTLLKAIELILASPADLKKDVLQMTKNFNQKYSGTKSSHEIQKLAAKKIISKYSYYAAFAGGASSLPGTIPGVGTIVSTVGGTSADVVLTMKFQIEMIMAIATIYGMDIENEEQKRICFLIAGLGALNQSAKEGGKKLGSQAFIRLVRQHLKGSVLLAVKKVFQKVGLTFTRKALEKNIPFGIGVILGVSINKGLTVYVGRKGLDFYSA